mmetsp:Transcript_31738/g.36084  ORF Transcript_31738/g.36084 Transcript_31738/m.36084 type:complete len:602 (-) Transcript_31738:184-1989(-)
MKMVPELDDADSEMVPQSNELQFMIYGGPKSGKTFIIKSFCEENLSVSFIEPTEDILTYYKNCTLPNTQPAHIKIWDIPGRRTLNQVPFELEDLDAMILVYNSTDTLDFIRKTLSQFVWSNNYVDGVSIFIVANQIQDTALIATGMALATQYGYTFFHIGKNFLTDTYKVFLNTVLAIHRRRLGSLRSNSSREESRRADEYLMTELKKLEFAHQKRASIEDLSFLETRYSNLSTQSQAWNEVRVETFEPTMDPFDDFKLFKHFFDSYVQEDIQEKKGWMKKKSPSRFVGYQNRFFHLRHKKLFYYKNEGDGQAKGVLDFDLVTYDLEVCMKSGNSLTINETNYESQINELTEETCHLRFKLVPMGSRRTFMFKTESLKSLQEWLTEIRKHVLHSRGFKQRHDSLPFRAQKFWKYETVSKLDIQNLAETGDLILFKSRGIGNSAQRLLRGTIYDHVGIFLRMEQNELYFLEATSTDGVNIVLWDDFISRGWHNAFSKMVYRRLDFDRHPDDMENLEKFVVDAFGDQYSLKPGRLVRVGSALEAREIYYSAGIVADCYKKLGLVEESQPSSKFYADKFSARKALGLKTEAELGPEILVDFKIE